MGSQPLACILQELCVMSEILKDLALQEFGTLEGVTITYSIDESTGRVHYCFTRK